MDAELLDDFGGAFMNEDFDATDLDFDMGFMLDDEDEFHGNQPQDFKDASIKVEKSLKGDDKQQSKKRKCNPDSAAIAAVTEETLKALELDPNSKDGKKKKRQIRNRMSAQYHRDRKNAYIRNLEQIVSERTEEIQRLREEVNALVTENNSLRAAAGRPFLNVPVRYDVTSSPASIAANGYTDNDDSDECSVQSGTTSGKRETGSFDFTFVSQPPVLLPPITSLPIFQHQRLEISMSPNGQLPSASLASNTISDRAAHPFGASPLSRSLTLISMVCVISFMILGGGGGGGSSGGRGAFTGGSGISSSLSATLLLPEHSFLEAGPGGKDSTSAAGRRLLISGGTEGARTDNADGNAGRLSEMFMSFSFQQPPPAPSFDTLRDEEGRAGRKRNLRHSAESAHMTPTTNSSSIGDNSTYALSSRAAVVRVNVKSEAGSEGAREGSFGAVQRLQLPDAGLSDSGGAFRSAKGVYLLPEYPSFAGRSLSQSAVFMSAGRALLDPAILDPAAGRMPTTLQQRHPAGADAVRLISGGGTPHSAGALVPTSSPHSTTAGGHRGDAHSLIVSAPHSSSSIRDPSERASPNQEGLPQRSADARQQMLSQLLSESNLLTIQLPVSAIAVGSRADATGGADDGLPQDRSLDAILRVLNLQGADGWGSSFGQKFEASGQQGGGVNASQPAARSVEFTCMILGAKVVAATGGPTSSTA